MRAVAAAALTAGTAMAWAVRGRSSSVFGPSVWRGPAQGYSTATGNSLKRKSIALTFDDGPSPSTGRVLELLGKHEAPATFFQVGLNVQRARELTQAVHVAGHELGNHSHTHPNFAFARPSFIEDEFSRAQDAILNASGVRSVLMRAPYGVRWFGFRAMQERLGLTGVMWSVIGLDWKLGAQQIAERVLRNACPGAIICLHDGRGTQTNPNVTEMIEALKRILPSLKERGYHFETVSELLCPTTN